MTTLVHSDPSLIQLSSSFADAEGREPFLLAPAREGVRFIHGALVGMALSALLASGGLGILALSIS